MNYDSCGKYHQVGGVFWDIFSQKYFEGTHRPCLDARKRDKVNKSNAFIFQSLAEVIGTHLYGYLTQKSPLSLVQEIHAHVMLKQYELFRSRARSTFYLFLPGSTIDDDTNGQEEVRVNKITAEYASIENELTTIKFMI